MKWTSQTLGLLCCLGVFALFRVALATDVWVGWKERSSSLVVTFSNLPPAYTLETSLDLTNWHSVVVSGDVPPLALECTLTNSGHAQFYRVVPR